MAKTVNILIVYCTEVYLCKALTIRSEYTSLGQAGREVYPFSVTSHVLFGK